MPVRLPERPMTPKQVAEFFAVSLATVTTWADKGLIPHFRTPGGHRRFLRSDVEAFSPRDDETSEGAA